MQTGAVIVAAGTASRMGEFKPMLNVGSISVAQRIVATLQQAGVSKIVMITGHNAAMLEHHLSNHGIIFLRNEEYETTQMFDSAKIGLEYLKDKCDKILFTPVDVPLFTAQTVRMLLQSEAELVCPLCNGRTGHPMAISASLVDVLLDYRGSSGMQGAIACCGTPLSTMEVADPGILHDADTPGDYQTLLQSHNAQLVRPVVNVELVRETGFFDQRIAMLLTLVGETLSVRTACQRMQISYSTGWNIIRKLEFQLKKTLIERSQGGARSGRSRLTEDGVQFLCQYQQYVDDLRSYAAERYPLYFQDIL